MIETQERNRAVRCAYGRARANDARAAKAWLDVADTFAPVSDRAREHVERLLAQHAALHPGQLNIDGRTVAEEEGRIG